MPAITATVTLRVPPELLEVIDSCRGRVSRNEWMVTALQWAYANRGAVEQALGTGSPEVVQNGPPAPAEQPETWREVQADRAAGANPVRPAREFRPYPKGGK